MKTNLVFVNIMAVLGLVLGIMISNPNSAQADPRPKTGETVEQICGNGVLEGTEECDDGDTNNGDGCNAVCEIELAEPKVEKMEVDKLEAKELTTPALKADKLEAKELTTPLLKADKLEVGTLTVKGSENFPLHEFGILANYGTSFGSPYSLQLRMKYSAMWGVDTKGTLLGLGLEGGVGFWNWYDMSKSVQPMIPLAAFFQIGTVAGGLSVGPELWILWPLNGHGSDEKSELMTMIRAGGWINIPGQHSANAFVLQPWIGIPVYQPRNPSSPKFNNPAFLFGLSLGWGHTFNPIPETSPD